VIRSLSGGAVVALVALAAPAALLAQAEDDAFKKPETPAEFWNAVKFELSVGKYDLAAQFLQGFLDSKPTDEDYLKIIDRDGLAAFLRLRNVPKWFQDAKANAGAVKTAEAVIDNATTALRKQLSDPVRIERFFRALSGSEDEKQFALKELARSGAAVVPVALDILQANPSDEERDAILLALPRLPDSTVPPLLAALDVADRGLRTLLFNSLIARPDLTRLTRTVETDPIPTLAFFAEAADQPTDLRRLAAAKLDALRAATGEKPVPAKVLLTRRVDNLLDHKAKFIDPQQVTLWRLVDNKLVSDRVPVADAEEYFGLRFARRALQLDPADEAAQVAFLTLAVERAVLRAPPSSPLAVAAPKVHDLLAAAPTRVLAGTLDRALRQKRSPVASAVATALAGRGDALATVADRPEPYVLVRALRYPDRRVQFAAATALTRLPGPPRHQASAAVVEVLRRIIAGDPDPGDPAAGKPRVLIGDPDRDRAEAIARLAREAGYASEVVQTGRDLLRRLNAAADVDVVVLDHRIPYPQLAKLLGELRADIHYGLLPVRVMTASPLPNPPPGGAERVLRTLIAPYDNVDVIREPLSVSLFQQDLAQAAGPASPPLTDAEKAGYTGVALELLRRMATGDLAGYDVRPAEAALRQALRNDGLAPTAAEALGRIPGRPVQESLADLVLDANRPAPVRSRAAASLLENVRRFGSQLPAARVKALQELAAGGNYPSELRTELTVFASLFGADAKATGQRLSDYVPPVPAPPMAPKKPAAPKGEKKDNE
jgi:CheY-like chemotaxis protein